MIFPFLTIVPGSGQSSNIEIGFISGLHVSNLDEGRFLDYDFFYPGAGYFLGLTLDKNIGRNLEINSEILLIHRIVKEKYLDETGPILDFNISDHRLYTHSLMIPVSINYSIDRLHIQGGIYGELIVDRSESGNPHNTEVKNLSFNKDLNGGWLIGGHYDFYNLEIGMRKMIGWIKQETHTYEQDGIREVVSLYTTDDLQFYIKYLF